MDADELKAIEDGLASDEQCGRYAVSLDRIEAWSPERRAQQYKLAGIGRRFEPDES